MGSEQLNWMWQNHCQIWALASPSWPGFIIWIATSASPPATLRLKMLQKSRLVSKHCICICICQLASIESPYLFDLHTFPHLTPAWHFQIEELQTFRLDGDTSPGGRMWYWRSEKVVRAHFPSDFKAFGFLSSLEIWALKSFCKQGWKWAKMEAGLDWPD